MKTQETEVAADDTATDWWISSMSELADHIEETHHTRLRRALPELRRKIEDVVLVEGMKRPGLFDLRREFNALAEDLARHIERERTVLFPMCRELDAATSRPEFRCQTVRHPVFAMIRDHEDGDAALNRLRDLADGYAAPSDAPPAYAELMQALAEFDRDLRRCIHEENDILFVRAVRTEKQLSRPTR